MNIYFIYESTMYLSMAVQGKLIMMSCGLVWVVDCGF